MGKLSRIVLGYTPDGLFALEYVRVVGDRGITAGRLTLGRPPRVGSMNPNSVLAAAFIMYGHLIEGDLTVNFEPAHEFVTTITKIWPVNIHVVPSTDVLVYANSNDDIGERELLISDDPSLLGGGDLTRSLLLVLPHDRFNGFIGSMFSIALASNACYETHRLQPSSGVVAGLVAMGIIWSPALKSGRLIMDQSRVDLADMSRRQLSTLSVLGLRVGTE